jgi:hypothetical protein
MVVRCLGLVATLLGACGDDNGIAPDFGGGGDGGGTYGDATIPPEDLSLPGPCAEEMALVALPDGGLCVDRWEAYVVELADGGERPHSPFQVIAGATVAARSAAGVTPQGYISQVEASAACANAGKRLCTATEFAQACRGPDAGDFYPYGGGAHQTGYCNEGKGSSMARFFGTDPNAWTYAEFNDPILNQWDGGLAPTASFPHCLSPGGVWDCVGNLHEWGAHLSRLLDRVPLLRRSEMKRTRLGHRLVIV